MSTAVPPAKPSPAKAPTWSAAAQFVFSEWKNIETFHALEDLVTEEIDEMISTAADVIGEDLPGGQETWVRNLTGTGSSRGFAYRKRQWLSLDVALGVYYDRGHWTHLNLRESHVFVAVYAPGEPERRANVAARLRELLENGDDFDKTLAKLVLPNDETLIRVGIKLADDDRTGKKFFETIVDQFDEMARAISPHLDVLAKGGA